MDATSRPTPASPDVSANDDRTKKRTPLVERRRTSPALAAFVVATIVAGVAALAWVTLTVPLGPAIATDALPHIATDDRVSGLLFWIAIGLLGSVRTKGYAGRTVLTFHLPFIVAAMTLGGPVAGGWVAAISTIELRELREVPWFGTLSNHAIVALAGVVGGAVVAGLQGPLGAVLDPSLAMLVAAACGAVLLCAVDVGLSATTIAIREGLGYDELAAVFNASFRQTLGAEVLLGWLLAVVYVSIAWWAPIACFLLIAVVWRANDEHELTTHDAMTGLLNRQGFNARYDATVRRVLARPRSGGRDHDRPRRVQERQRHARPRRRRRGPQAGRGSASWRDSATPISLHGAEAMSSRSCFPASPTGTRRGRWPPGCTSGCASPWSSVGPRSRSERRSASGSCDREYPAGRARCRRPSDVPT